MVEIKDVVRLPDTRGLRPPTRTSRPPAGRASVSSATCRTAAGSPTTRAGCCICSTATTSRRSTRTSPRRSRSRFTTGWKAGSSGSTSTRNSRATACSTRCTANARLGNPATPNFIPPGFTPADVTLPQRHHRVARDEPGGEHVRGHQARAAARRPRRPEPHAPDGQRRVQPDGEAGRQPTTACSTRAAATSGSATAADRTRTIPGQTQRLDSVITAILRIDPRSPSVSRGNEGSRRLHDSAVEQVRGRRRSEDARRDLRVRLPQRAPAVVGSHRRDDVRVATSG